MLRKFNWLSSVDPVNRDVLNILNDRMINYYSALESRTRYNDQLLQGNDDEQSTDEISLAFKRWFASFQFENILEIGCGTGRIRKLLEQTNYEGRYTGTEVSAEVVADNAKRWPSDNWFHTPVYSLPFEKCSFDLCFSFYVLEHLIFPKEALDEIYEMVAPGGSILLVFPDFVATGMMPSQHLGFGFERSALQKLRNFNIIDALVSIYDSRVRLRSGLNSVAEAPGRFIINASPECLHTDNLIWPDIDAVYIANKREVIDWANSKSLKIHLPYGNEGIFKRHSFLAFTKNG